MTEKWILQIPEASRSLHIWVFLSCYTPHVSQPSLSSAGPLGACRKAFQVAFVPAKWGARGQRQFSRMYHGGIVFLLAAERNTSRMLGDGEVRVGGSCRRLIVPWGRWRNHLVLLLEAQMVLWCCVWVPGRRTHCETGHAETGKREQELGCPWRMWQLSKKRAIGVGSLPTSRRQRPAAPSGWSYPLPPPAPVFIHVCFKLTLQPIL